MKAVNSITPTDKLQNDVEVQKTMIQDYSSYELPQEDVTPGENVAILVDREEKLHLIGTGRVERAVSVNEWKDMKQKRNYFIVSVVSVEKDFATYVAPYTTSPLEPGIQIPWKRANLYNEEIFKKLTRSTREPNMYQTVNDFFHSQPNAKRTRHSEVSLRPVEDEPTPKRQKLETQPILKAEELKTLVSNLASPIEPDGKKTVSDAIGYILSALKLLRNVTDPPRTNDTMQGRVLKVGNTAYYPTREQWSNLDKDQPCVVLQELLLISAAQLGLDFAKNSYVMPGTKSRKLLDGKVKISKNAVDLIQASAEQYCNVFSGLTKKETYDRKKFVKKMGLALVQLHLKRFGRDSDESIEIKDDPEDEDTQVDEEPDDMQDAQISLF